MRFGGGAVTSGEIYASSPLLFYFYFSRLTPLGRLRRQILLDYYTIPPATRAKGKSTLVRVSEGSSYQESTVIIAGNNDLFNTKLGPQRLDSFPTHASKAVALADGMLNLLMGFQQL